jgi:hypothetical protein
MKKYRYYIIVTTLAIFFVGMYAIINILPYFTKPAGRQYTGLQGYVDDYVGYVSYVKEGMYGNNTFSIRSLPPPQPATSAQLILVYTGKIAGLIGMDAPTAYHTSRILFGLMLYALMWEFFVLLFGNKKVATAATLVASVSGPLGWYAYNGGAWVYQTIATFGFTDNIIGRFCSRPHYLLGAILFIAVSAIHLLRPNIRKPARAVVLVFILSLVAGTVHPSFTVMLAAITAIMMILRVIEKRRFDAIFTSYLACGMGSAIGLILSYWSTHQYPYTSILAFEEYVLTEKIPLSTMFNDVIVFGPALWIGVVGLVLGLFRGEWKNEKHRYMVLWIVVQFAFFFHFYKYFRSERVRYVQSLYFIPMAYGTVYLIQMLAKKFGKRILVGATVVFVVISVPTYIQHFKSAMFSQVNYRDYDRFQFPTDGMMEAYRWLDKHTPTESTVVAGYEAANNIIMYSHNYVIGNKQGWPSGTGNQMELERDTFFEGLWPEQIACGYLKKNNVSYIYDGYQEPDGFRKYGCMKQIFADSDATIYEVIPEK